MQNIVFLLLAAVCAGLGFEVYLRRRAAPQGDTWDTRALPAPDPQATRIVVLGDSIAYGQYLDEAQAWPALLAERLVEEHPQRHWQVVNAGVPGDTVADAYLRFNTHVAAYRPRLVLIALGLNDCHRTGSSRADLRLAHFRQYEMTSWGRSYLIRAVGQRLRKPVKPAEVLSPTKRPIVPLDDYQAIMTWLVKRCQRLGSQPVFVTLTPLRPGLTDEADGEWGLWADYNQAMRELGRALNTPVIEVSHRFPPGANWIEDGVHLSAEGQATLAGRVWQGLQRPNLAPALALYGQVSPRGSNAEMAPSLD